MDLTLLWSETGNQGDRWHEAAVDINRNEPYRIVIVGELDNVLFGDLAIDDTYMHEVACSERPVEPPLLCDNGTLNITKDQQCNWVKDCDDGQDEIDCGQCTFEDDQCGYVDISRGDYEWERMKGSTSTPETGPSVDCTGNKEGKHKFIGQFSPAWGQTPHSSLCIY
ncbi:MAM and LDL-receptor class A domain-containing protein 1-like [Saccoglossus kowalevskii]